MVCLIDNRIAFFLPSLHQMVGWHTVNNADLYPFLSSQPAGKSRRSQQTQTESCRNFTDHLSSLERTKYIPNTGSPLLCVTRFHPFLLKPCVQIPGFLSKYNYNTVTLIVGYFCCVSLLIWSTVAYAEAVHLEMHANTSRLSPLVFRRRIIIPRHIQLYGLTSDPCNLNDFGGTVCGTCSALPLRAASIVVQRRLLNRSIT